MVPAHGHPSEADDCGCTSQRSAHTVVMRMLKSPPPCCKLLDSATHLINICVFQRGQHHAIPTQGKGLSAVSMHWVNAGK